MLQLKNNIKQLSHFIQKCQQHKHAHWYFAGIFAFTIFLQCWLFHYLAFDEILTPLAFYLPKIVIGLFFASFVLFFKVKWWTIIVSLLFNVWILTELIYSRSNAVFLDAYSFTMVGNMDGFWDSIFAFMYKKDLLLVIPIVLLIVAWIVFRNNQRNWRHAVYCLIISILLHCFATHTVYRNKYKWGKLTKERMIKTNYTLNPFGQKIRDMLGRSVDFDLMMIRYMSAFSVIHHFVLNVTDFLHLEESNYVLPQEDEERVLKTFINAPIDAPVNPSSPLIICLIESLESWVVNPEIMPNLSREIENNPHLLYCPNIECQRRGGNSSDGQLIVNTGLLPLAEGATVYRFPLNKYPSLSSLYRKTIGLFPHRLGVWNQRYMNQSYAINEAIEISKSDKIIFQKIVNLSKTHDYILALTMSTHAPHEEYADSSKIHLSSDFSKRTRNYVKSVNYMDEGLGLLLKAWHTDERLQSSTIVITSDHNIFKRKEALLSGKHEYLNQKVGICPLVILSPKINGNICLKETYGQMDIYPTILHLIDCEDYYWKGFGINLLDSTARTNRPISEHDAFILSDQIIRANWFKTLGK